MTRYALAEIFYAEMDGVTPKEYTLISLDDSKFSFQMDEPAMKLIKALEAHKKLTFEELTSKVFAEIGLDVKDQAMLQGAREVLDFLVTNKIVLTAE